MGKPIHKHTKDLNELLDHLNKPADDLDAFEQEALEGFSQLENKQEAFDLKQRLDARMEDELFSKKRRPLFIYWSAAAGVALLVSLIFIFKSNGEFDKQALADNATAAEQNANQITASPPTQDVIAGVKPIEEKTNNVNRLAQGPGKNQEVLREDNQQTGMGGKSGETSASAEDMEAEPAKNKEQNDLAAKSTSKDLDNLDDKKRDENGAPASANAPVTTKSNEERAKSKSSEDEFKETKATDYFTSRKIKKEKQKADQSASASEAKGEIEGPFEKSTIKNASLIIKESELNAKITKFFADKDYKKSFTCTLTIDKYDKVDAIVFPNGSLFKKSEIKEITEFFKKQKCFKNHEYALFSTYTVTYKAE